MVVIVVLVVGVALLDAREVNFIVGRGSIVDPQWRIVVPPRRIIVVLVVTVALFYAREVIF